MCGIVGYINYSPMHNPCKAWLTQALLVDSLRGFDATGICLIPRKENSIVYKKSMAGFDFVETRGFRSAMKTLDPVVAIGHNRSATTGAINDNNAHPFAEDNIVLVHNGTLLTRFGLPNSDVDSRSIALALNENENAKEVLESLDGSFTLVWFDYRNQTINFARNTDRPLYIGISSTKQIALFASERWMLEGLAWRNEINLKKIFELPAFVLFKASFVADEVEFEKEQFERFISKIIGVSSGRGYYKEGGGTTEEEIFKELGIKKGDKIQFFIDRIQITGNSSTVEGFPVANNKAQIRSYTVDRDVLNTIGDDDVLEGTVSFAFESKSSGKYTSTIIVHDVVVLTEEEVQATVNQYFVKG